MFSSRRKHAAHEFGMVVLFSLAKLIAGKHDGRFVTLLLRHEIFRLVFVSFIGSGLVTAK